jgi:hypothetical protein
MAMSANANVSSIYAGYSGAPVISFVGEQAPGLKSKVPRMRRRWLNGLVDQLASAGREQ